MSTAIFVSLLLAGCSSAPNAPSSSAGSSAVSNAVSTATPETVALALACTSCHTTSQRSGLSRALPELYGRRASTLKQQLLGFKRGTRDGTLMPRLIAAYSEQELHELADYFANSSATP